MKVSTKITIFILLSIISYNINGQTTELKEYSKNNVYLDASSLVFFSQISINYERILYNGKNISWYGRLGAGKTILFIDKNRKTNNNKEIEIPLRSFKYAKQSDYGTRPWPACPIYITGTKNIW